jgi:predicted homoserine dehydrogenase-like protein
MILQELEKLEADNKPIRIGVSGAGWMASGFISQVQQMKGMVVNLVADENLRAAVDLFLAIGVPRDQIVEASSAGRAMDALRKDKKVVTGSYTLAPQLPAVDIVADVTSWPCTGAETAYACTQYKKDMVLVNIEADVTVGRILKKLACDAGVLYTVSSGDEPGCLAELWDFVVALGHEPIVIGKGKNNPMNPAATPETVAESAAKSVKDPYQVASYVDGTKTMFEMTCAANALGCRPMRRGMVGPVATFDNVTEIFMLEQDGGIVTSPATVDFVQGKSMSGGVFITARVHNPRIAADLAYMGTKGKGNYFTFFRPYHLWFLEAPLSVARAFLYKKTTLVPMDQPVADVFTIAKKDLNPGEKLDTFGGYTFYGQNDLAEEVKRLNGLPVGLAPGAEMIHMVRAGEIVSWQDVKLDETSIVVKLRRMQDAL